MKSIEMQWTGVRPLIMNNCIGLDVLHPLVKEINAINKKRTKTEDDVRSRDWLQYQSSLYIDKKIGPYIPAQNIEACLRDGGKKTKEGKNIQAAVFVSTEKFAVLLDDGTYAIPLDYDGPRNANKLYEDPAFILRARVVQARMGLMKVRPRFINWSVRFALEYDEGVIGKSALDVAATNAGSLIGLCDFRPKYGRFQSEIVK